LKIWFGITSSLYAIHACLRLHCSNEAGSFSIETAVLAALYELKIKFAKRCESQHYRMSEIELEGVSPISKSARALDGSIAPRQKPCRQIFFEG